MSASGGCIGLPGKANLPDDTPLREADVKLSQGSQDPKIFYVI